jgi:hypothetical protein
MRVAQHIACLALLAAPTWASASDSPTQLPGHQAAQVGTWVYGLGFPIGITGGLLLSDGTMDKDGPIPAGVAGAVMLPIGAAAVAYGMGSTYIGNARMLRSAQESGLEPDTSKMRWARGLLWGSAGMLALGTGLAQADNLTVWEAGGWVQLLSVPTNVAGVVMADLQRRETRSALHSTAATTHRPVQWTLCPSVGHLTLVGRF